MLLRAVAVAATATPLAFCTVYADSSPPAKIKASQLPIYGDPEPGEFKLVADKQTPFHKNVTVVRKEIWKFLDKYQETQDTVVQKYEVSKAHTQDLLAYIRSDAGIIPQAIIITVAGLGGIVASYKGGFIRRTLYCGVALAAAGAICYPNQAVDLSNNGWKIVKGQTKTLWNEQMGKKKENVITKVKTAEESTASKDVKTSIESSTAKVDESQLDHGMSKAEDKDMYTTRG